MPAIGFAFRFVGNIFLMELNQVFYYKKLQRVMVDNGGVILHTENTLFQFEASSNIKDFNPIFETLLYQLYNENQLELVVPCLQLENEKRNIYCDVRLKRELGYTTILFFNFTKKYQSRYVSRVFRRKTAIHCNKKVNSIHMSLTLGNILAAL